MDSLSVMCYGNRIGYPIKFGVAENGRHNDCNARNQANVPRYWRQ
jgi:hypothetical protein